MKINFVSKFGLSCVALSLTACGTIEPEATSGQLTSTVATATIESALPYVRTGAAVATGAVLNFAVKQNETRTRLANEMYAAASAVYSLSAGTFPTPAQLQASILAFGGSQVDVNYMQFSTAIGGLYASYYSKLVAGDAKTAADLLNAIAGGIEDASVAYITTPVVTARVAATAASF